MERRLVYIGRLKLPLKYNTSYGSGFESLSNSAEEEDKKDHSRSLLLMLKKKLSHDHS